MVWSRDHEIGPSHFDLWGWGECMSIGEVSPWGSVGKKKAGEIRRGSLDHSSDYYSIKHYDDSALVCTHCSEGGFCCVVDALSDRMASPCSGFLCLGDGGCSGR